MALALGASIGCRSEPDSEPIKDFRAVTQDSSAVTLRVQYRRDGCNGNDKPTDCYYYIATFKPRSTFNQDLQTPPAQPLGRVSPISPDSILSVLNLATANAKKAGEKFRPQDVEAFISEESNGQYTNLCALEASTKSWRIFAHLHLRFYDPSGFSLYHKTTPLASGNSLAPGWNDVPDESQFRDGVWTWKGRFPKEDLPLGAFKDGIEMRADLEPGCP